MFEQLDDPKLAGRKSWRNGSWTIYWCRRPKAPLQERPDRPRQREQREKAGFRLIVQNFAILPL